MQHNIVTGFRGLGNDVKITILYGFFSWMVAPFGHVMYLTRFFDILNSIKFELFSMLYALSSHITETSRFLWYNGFINLSFYFGYKEY